MSKEIKKKPAKYISVSINEQEKFKEIGDRVQKKELKWSFYSSGFHYYLILQ